MISHHLFILMSGKQMIFIKEIKMKKDSFSSAIHRAYAMLDRLELLPRTGYQLTGVSAPEKIASHCFSTTWLTMVISSRMEQRGDTIDRLKALELAILHETGEIFIGDLVPGASRALGKNTKEKAELEFGSRFLQGFDVRLSCRFQNYFDPADREAKLVQECDRLQLILKAGLYLLSGHRGCSHLLHKNRYSFTFPECAQIAECVWNELDEADIRPPADGTDWDRMPDEQQGKEV